MQQRCDLQSGKYGIIMFSVLSIQNIQNVLQRMYIQKNAYLLQISEKAHTDSAIFVSGRLL